jgi:hypothetical protein
MVDTSDAPDCSVNVWTKPTSGRWEQPFWSCDQLPSMDQPWIAFTNSGRKVLEIDRHTAAKSPNSLTVRKLTVEAPAGSSNQLLLNYAGTNVPLTVQWLRLGTNASLASYYSALEAKSFDLLGPALFADDSSVKAGYIPLGANLTLSNSSASVGFLSVRPEGSVTHAGGTGEFSAVMMNGDSTFTLQGGALLIGQLVVQSYPDFPPDVQLTNGVARYVQANGDLVCDLIRLGTPKYYNYPYHRAAEFVLQGGTITSSRLHFSDGTFTQTGGTNSAGIMILPGLARNSYSRAQYLLSSGTLISGSLSLGAAPDWPNPPNSGSFSQSGGIHTNSSMSLLGQFNHAKQVGITRINRLGSYALSGGLLVSDKMDVSGGSFGQSGGTNQIQELAVSKAGAFGLSEGELITSNVIVNTSGCYFNGNTRVCFASTFTQDGGIHGIEDTLRLGGIARYELRSGLLVAGSIVIGANSQLNCENGTIINGGVFTIQGGVFRAGDQSHELGQLQLLEATRWIDVPPADAVSLNVSGPGGTVLRFRASRDVPWSGPALRIFGWQPWDGDGGGSHRVFFGDNSEGLSEDQLNRLVFVDPGGWPRGNYPAWILPTGEVVPVLAP